MIHKKIMSSWNMEHKKRHAVQIESLGKRFKYFLSITASNKLYHVVHITCEKGK